MVGLAEAHRVVRVCLKSEMPSSVAQLARRVNDVLVVSKTGSPAMTAIQLASISPNKYRNLPMFDRQEVQRAMRRIQESANDSDQALPGSGTEAED